MISYKFDLKIRKIQLLIIGLEKKTEKLVLWGI
jgi:hypothetical protein